MKRVTSVWVGVLLLASTACAALPSLSPPTSPPWSMLWLAKSAGTWEKEGDYGYYKILVFRQIAEHSRDYVLVQITRIVATKKENDNSTQQEVIRSFWLETPSIKGYIDDVHLKKIDEQRMALMLDINMNGMDGVVLRELYVLHPDGTFKLLQPANGIDLYE